MYHTALFALFLAFERDCLANRAQIVRGDAETLFFTEFLFHYRQRYSN